MRLVIAYDSRSDLIPAWCLMDEHQQIIQQGSNQAPSEIAQAVKPYHFTVTVLLMSPDVMVTQIPRPQGSLAKIRQALPYLLEEQLVDDVANLHFTILNQLDHQTLIVAIIARDVLETCLDMLSNQGLRPEVVLPLWLVLPEAGLQNWHALLIPEYFWLRSGKYTGLAIEPFMADKILSALFEGQSPLNIDWLSTEPLDPLWLEICNQHQVQVENKIISYEHWFEVIAQSLPETIEMNLLHSEFSFKQQLTSQKQTWKWVGILASSIAGIWLLGLFAQYFYFRFNDYLLTQKMNDEYQLIFPGAELTGNPRAAVERELMRIANGGIGTDFLSVLLRVGTIIQEFPQIQLLEMHYENKKLSLNINTDNFSRLRQLEEACKKQNIPIKQEDATSANGVVTARLILG